MSYFFSKFNHMFTSSRHVKRIFVLLLDAIFLYLSIFFSIYILTLINFPLIVDSNFYILFPSFFVLIVLGFSGLYYEIFRFGGISTFIKIFRSFILSGILLFPYYFYIFNGFVGLLFGFIHLSLFCFSVLLSRFIARVLIEIISNISNRSYTKRNVIIYGAGSAGRQLAVALINSKEVNVICFIDDDKRLQHSTIYGLKIHGFDFLNYVSSLFEIKPDILLAIPSASRQVRIQLLDRLKKFNFIVRTLPDLTALALGDINLSVVQELGVDDLLGRDQVLPDWDLMQENIKGKTILITGAGGSIGSELCRQILTAKPKIILLVDINEFSLYKIHQELELVIHSFEKNSCYLNDMGASEADSVFHTTKTTILPLLASVCDENRMNVIMSTWHPDTVFHAAAYKHVPLVEHNVICGVNNNVNGTRICAEVAIRNNVKKFVLVSTDKAVRPTNVMGASKRLSEMILQALSDEDNDVCFTMVRFGNVLGSSGSVVPLFRKQINEGGPVTLTHKDITRYFMSIPEAAQLVIQAGALGVGGDVFLLDMGEPVKIYDLAKRMIELAGHRVRDHIDDSLGDIEIKITGLRPGEKLYEELLIDDAALATSHPKIMKAHENFVKWDILHDKLTALNNAIAIHDVTLVRCLLQDLVVDYEPSTDLVDWVCVNNNNIQL